MLLQLSNSPIFTCSNGNLFIYRYLYMEIRDEKINYVIDVYNFSYMINHNYFALRTAVIDNVRDDEHRAG